MTSPYITYTPMLTEHLQVDRNTPSQISLKQPLKFSFTLALSTPFKEEKNSHMVKKKGGEGKKEEKKRFLLEHLHW